MIPTNSVSLSTGEKTGAFSLMQNFPNPFNPMTTLRFQIPEARGRKSEVSRVMLRVFDLLGREVATLVNENKTAGAYEIEFNAEHVPSGVYFYRLQSGDLSSTKKMLLLR
jgi:hypothetical protein